MVKVIKVPLPIDLVPQKFIYVLELEEMQACYLLRMLRSHYVASLTATEIVDGLTQFGLK